ncbi:TetR/AcrR family transcriptional regulator [Tyzzerella sp. OttesenSCG-928-J15]|nr:TetR/AcrR family transcriptional regulator [Tyzzerella sp. OttesenSCG-928-J15]
MVNTDSTSNKALRRKRTMRYFIEAASDILNNEGIDSLTTRNVAAKAGYNSATIYNYFGNFERLIAFAAIKGLKDYAFDLQKQINDEMSPVEKYIKIWLCYFKHSLKNPVVFSILFQQYGNNPLVFLQEYYDIFPEELQDLPKDIHETFFESDFDVRNRLLLNKGVEVGLFKVEDVDSIVDMSQFIFEGVLVEARKSTERYNINVFLKYLKRVLLAFNPDLKETLDAIRV